MKPIRSSRSVVSALVLATVPALAQDPAPASAEPALLSSTGSERATTGLGNLVVTREGKTHAVWLDNEPASGEYWAKVATLDHATGQWSAPVPLARGFDNHCRPALAADAAGVLHVIVGGHNTVFKYLRSLKPNDASAWTKPVDFPKTMCGTYPFLLAGPDDTLWLTGRAVPQYGIHLYGKRGDAGWKLVATPFGREAQYKAYGGYNSMLAWSPDRKRLHLASDVYESPSPKRLGENQAIVYLATDDGGQTWTRADGSVIEGERVARTVDVLASSNHKRETEKGVPVLRLGGLVIDAAGRPLILYTCGEPAPSRALLVAPGPDGKWQEIGLADAVQQYAPDCRSHALSASLALTADGRLLATLGLTPLKASAAATDADAGEGEGEVEGGSEKAGAAAGGDKAKEIAKPASAPAAATREVLGESADGGKTWTFRPLPLPAGTAPLAPSLERVSGYNVVGASRPPALMYFTGLSRYRQPGEVLQNKVYCAPLK